MIGAYNLLIGLHIIAVIAWMAGLMMLPRLYAYHTETAPAGSEFDAHFQRWEGKLLKIILNPAMILVWVLGLSLIYVDSQVRGISFLWEPWMLTKIAGIVFMTGWSHFLGRARKGFVAGRRDRTAKFWRMTNELPFLAAIVMVLAVTTKFANH
ncbi:MAG TPA: CopD family protein [Phenylobacterium sp.]|jgi:putative membrane protein|uniref:CopD family protein n=1 Tax=Phenylobacterium sp. TaxID=1871053 RepID=UPI002D3800BD|nr:CopD family protein [Phenylobacterium sp.]HZZ69870.1 CopD family protein [Phenylobacterium sp.]